MKYASWISKVRQIPLSIHLADHSQVFETVKSSKILSSANKLICITDEMKLKYEKMLGRNDIEVLHNGAEKDCLQIPPPSFFRFSERNPFVVCFLGGLFSHLHGNCVEDFFSAVAILRQQKPWIEFHLYGQRQPNSYLADLVRSDGCFHHGIVMPLERKYDILKKAHCFVIPSSFEAESHADYRFSFPTKLPELIASGRPILSYGPKETAANRILETYNIGIRIHDRSVPKLVDALDNLVTQYQDSIKKFAPVCPIILGRFSADTVRRKLTRILSFN
jgi:glycosyltransferase involved in cell wall biosynthesis